VAIDYQAFVAGKVARQGDHGTTYSNPSKLLFQWQSEIVAWAVKRGRAAIFADCGLGKTLMQLEWAKQWRKTLIVCPLAVAGQTIREAQKLGLRVVEVTGPGSDDQLQIVNYEKVHKFVGAEYDGIVLDESSILKSVDGRTRTMMMRDFVYIPHRLCCTATPAPNDMAELANHAEFLGAMRRGEMLASFFVHDDAGWRLKGHAENDFWHWVSSWAVFMRRPSDVGHDDGDFILPKLTVEDDVVPCQWRPEGQLFADIGSGIGGRLEARRGTVEARVARAAEIIRDSRGQWVVWTGLNDESEQLAAELSDIAVEVAGKTPEDAKVERELKWRTGKARVLISKPKIFGFGMNWQHCHQVMFLGLGDSYEQYYQAIRRCWRFGQKKPVRVVIVIGDAETAVAANVKRKEEEVARMFDGVIESVREFERAELKCTTTTGAATVGGATERGQGWTLMHGDCVERIAEVKTGSVGLSIFSPPFASLYTYSASDRDMGNCKDAGQFFEHFRYLIPELLRVTMPGRRCCVHCASLGTTFATHGVIGWYDFRGDIIREFIKHGWVYDGEIVIDKDPQAQAIRTHAKGLLFVQKERDAAWLRPAMADYIIPFRAPGDNPEPVKSDVTNNEWIEFARPIWYGIRETETLNAAEAREEKDEKHICPLQLETIRRCVRLWTNRGDLVLSPFAGIGSEGYVAVKEGRRAVGIELKESYFRTAVRNMLRSTDQQGLFGGVCNA
jgi:DNA modification methylase/superfamily II DNA or RNA helicase